VSRPVGGVLSTLLRGMGGHPSKRPTWGLLPKERAGNPCPTLGLAPGGVYRAGRVAATAGALLPHRFTLACPGCPVIGGLFSVALSCGSPRLAVSQHPALWSPDLPRPVPAVRRLGSRPPSRLTVLTSVPNPDRCPSFLAGEPLPGRLTGDPEGLADAGPGDTSLSQQSHDPCGEMV
jgi:hypothetical protein